MGTVSILEPLVSVDERERERETTRYTVSVLVGHLLILSFGCFSPSVKLVKNERALRQCIHCVIYNTRGTNELADGVRLHRREKFAATWLAD